MLLRKIRSSWSIYRAAVPYNFYRTSGQFSLQFLRNMFSRTVNNTANNILFCKRREEMMNSTCFFADISNRVNALNYTRKCASSSIYWKMRRSRAGERNFICLRTRIIIPSRRPPLPSALGKSVAAWRLIENTIPPLGRVASGKAVFDDRLESSTSDDE